MIVGVTLDENDPALVSGDRDVWTVLNRGSGVEEQPKAFPPYKGRINR
jgi:hypothetical protein